MYTFQGQDGRYYISIMTRYLNVLSAEAKDAVYRSPGFSTQSEATAHMNCIRFTYFL